MASQSLIARLIAAGSSRWSRPDRPRRPLASLVKRGGRLLLVTVGHDPTFGPPHNVDEKEVRKLFGKDFEVEMLSREDKMEAEPHWKKRGATRFDEVAYMCRRK